jgi:hypothetical protein
VWQKEQVDTVIRLEKYLQGYPQTAQQKMEHLQGTTVKQMRDKHREPPCKALGEYYTLAQRHSTTSEPLHSIYWSSENE